MIVACTCPSAANNRLVCRKSTEPAASGTSPDPRRPYGTVWALTRTMLTLATMTRPLDEVNVIVFGEPSVRTAPSATGTAIECGV